MHVLNFGHGAFISVGAYAAALLFPVLAGSGSLAALSAIVVVALFAFAVTACLGLVFEKALVLPVYGQHLKQILMTMGGLIVSEEVLKALFGPQSVPCLLPDVLRGAFVIGDAAFEKYRLVAVVAGLLVYLSLTAILKRTKIGLLVRAGVEDREMVEALGYRIKGLFAGVFMAGAGLAGFGGLLWAFYREEANAGMGGEMMISVFLAVIIGGLGSVGGCLIASLLLALQANYVGFLAPKFALVSNLALMAAVLIWRPRGLYPKTFG